MLDEGGTIQSRKSSRLCINFIFLGGLSTFGGGDVIFALPSTSEKGYLDVLVEVSTPGGHSSVPPEHTVCMMISLNIPDW